MRINTLVYTAEAHTFVAEDPSPAAIRGESHLGFGYSKIVCTSSIRFKSFLIVQKAEGDIVEVSSWTAAKVRAFESSYPESRY